MYITLFQTWLFDASKDLVGRKKCRREARNYSMAQNKILVSTVKAETDSLARLSQSRTTYSTVDLSWKNPSDGVGVYRVVDKTDLSNPVVVSPNSTVAASATTTITRKGMQPGRTYHHSLERLEHDTWIQQISSTGVDRVVTTARTNSVSTSVGVETVQVTWDYKYDTQYSVTLFASGQSEVVARLESWDVELENGVHSVTLTGLAKGKAYVGKVFADDNGSVATIAEFNFVTSISATFQVDRVFASYATVTWFHHGSGAFESDGRADFRVLQRDARVASKSLPASEWEVVVASTPDTINNATVSGLKAGTMYDLKLQRLKLNRDWSDEASIMFTTKTTSLSIENVGPSSVEASWGPIYDDAIYFVRYGPTAGELVDFGGTVQDKTIGIDVLEQLKIAVLADLESNTEYIVELFVEEQGQRVGIATVALGTSASVKTKRNYTMVVASIVVVIVLALLIAKSVASSSV